MKKIISILSCICLIACATVFFWPETTIASDTENASSIMLIIDASGSMWGQIDGKNKITIARESLAGVINNLPDNINVGLTAYGHRQKGDCKDVEQIIPLSPLDKEKLTSFINSLNPKGKTPISLSIETAVNALKERKQETTVILVSDGLETCNADPCETTRTLRATGAKFVMHVVGFDVSNEENKQLQCIADAGGGKYFTAKNASQLTMAMGKITKPVVEGAVASLDHVGSLFVEAARDFIKYKVFAEDGKEVAQGDTRISTIPLPVGSYSVKASVAGAELSATATIIAKKTTTVFLGGTGTLFVEAVKDFVKFAVKDKMGNIVARGDTRISTLDLAVGDYDVSINLAGKECSAPVTINDGKHSTVSLKCTGRLFVDAAKDFVKYDVKDKTGTVIARGDTRISTLDLPEGDYDVTMNVTGRVCSTPVTIKKGQMFSYKTKCFGTLWVEADKDFQKFIVKDATGKEIVRGDSRISHVIVPPGEYTVHCVGRELPLKIVGADKHSLNFKNLEEPTGWNDVQDNKFTGILNAGIPGHNKETHENVSVSKCKQLCLERNWCKSIDYERKIGKCFVQEVDKTNAKIKTDYPGHPYDHYYRIDQYTLDFKNKAFPEVKKEADSPPSSPLHLQNVFQGQLSLQVFTGYFSVTNDKGEKETIHLQSPSPGNVQFGDIDAHYRGHGGVEAFGRPLEGEYGIFQDSYRLHVFEKAIIIWRRHDRAIGVAKVAVNNARQSLIINAKGKFLLASSNDSVAEPLIINLSQEQLSPGDKITIRVLGTYQFDKNRPTEFMNDTNAVFSSSDVLLEKTELHRVPGAIDYGADIKTDVTWFGKSTTDIPEDFDARDAEVIIPQKAKFLFVGVTDGYVADNAADSSYRVEIAKR